MPVTDTNDVAADIAAPPEEPRRFIRGLMFGLVLSVMAWAAIGYGLIRLFG